ncbi:MAG: DUF547 domain-containing protein [Ekhidna sp.]
MRKFHLIALLFTVSLHLHSQSHFDRVNSFLVKEIVFGLVNYSDLKENTKELDGLITEIATHNLKDSTANYKAAFYINAYNLLVIKQIRDNYPINRPLDVKGFFKNKKFTVAREQLTLDEIEFKKLILQTKDPRIHFALGCGARSCPFLYDNAFTPDNIEEQLQFRAELIIDRPNYVLVDEKKKTVTLNKIFDWYSDQFIKAEGSLLKYINKYRFYAVPEDYKVTFQEYDWTLNDNK